MDIARYSLSEDERKALCHIVTQVEALKPDSAFPLAASESTLRASKNFSSANIYWLDYEQYREAISLKNLKDFLVQAMYRQPHKSLALLDGLPIDKNAADILLLISSMIGTVIEYHGHGAPIVEISDKGRPPSNRPSSDNNLDFPLHTDLSFNAVTPTFITYLMLQPGKNGGESLFCDASDVISRLDDDDVHALQQPVIFPSPPYKVQPALEAPILTYNPLGQEQPLIRYRRDGLRVPSEQQKSAVQKFELIAQENTKQIALVSGQMAVWRNSKTLHGRKGFIDDPNANRRSAYRAYVLGPC